MVDDVARRLPGGAGQPGGLDGVGVAQEEAEPDREGYGDEDEQEAVPAQRQDAARS